MVTATDNPACASDLRDPASTELHDQIDAQLREAIGDERPGAGNVLPVSSDTFVITERIEQLARRALDYLGAGYPVNLEGHAGTGKTTLALHLAERIGRPVSLIHGDDQINSADLIGGEQGFRKCKSIDNFVHSVLKTEETTKRIWVDNRLTVAVREGHTLIYDEFTRSRPEANNVLLSILSEGILNLPKRQANGEGYLHAHPEFRAIFTCNPEEYAGVHRSQDALLDRMIPIRMDDYDRETEVAITRAKGGVAEEDARRIVDVVRTFRELDGYAHRPSIRAAIMIARVTAYRRAACDPEDPVFQRTCRDALGLDEPRKTAGQPFSEEVVIDGIRKAWS
jgi:gas vesicle protein GvpN